MSPSENDPPTEEPTARRGDVAAKEAEVLKRVRDVAKRIVDRVDNALSGTGAHSSLPTEEKKPPE